MTSPSTPRSCPEYLTAPQASHTFVYVSTIQRMAINLFGWEGAFAQTASDPDYEEDEPTSSTSRSMPST